MKTILKKAITEPTQDDPYDHSPFTSKGYPFRKDRSSYEPYWLGRAFFSDGGVTKRGNFKLFDNINN